MTQRRRRGGNIPPEKIAEAITKSVFGGTKDGHRIRQEMPIASAAKGISLEWEHPGREKYPTYLIMEMTDGAKVRYQIKVDQPVFSPALLDLENMQRGYPPEAK